MTSKPPCHCDAYPFPHRVAGGRCDTPKHLHVIGQYRGAVNCDDSYERDMQNSWIADRAADNRWIDRNIR